MWIKMFLLLLLYKESKSAEIINSLASRKVALSRTLLKPGYGLSEQWVLGQIESNRSFILHLFKGAVLPKSQRV